jgi:hypothetical protein
LVVLLKQWREDIMGSLGKAVASMAVAGLLASFAGQAQSSVFAAWEISNVAFGDTLNVRKYPANSSQKQAAYPNGTVLQMTGKCTGGVNLHSISSMPAWKQRQAVRYNWCQVWHDPAQNGNFVTGWVYGKYISPY